MEDLEMPPGSPVTGNYDEPQGNADPEDPLRPEVEEEDGASTPTLANPLEDTEAHIDEQVPMDEEDEDNAAMDEDDLESELDELDEKEFDNFDPSALNIPDKPLAVDDSNVGLLGVHKRKRTAEEEAERERKKKKKQNRREKPKRVRKTADNEEEFEGGMEVDGKRTRKTKVGPDGRPIKSSRRPRSPEIDEETLPADERRRRALDRKMDEALKSHRVSRRKLNATIEERADREVDGMRVRMANACQLDAEARKNGAVATHKLTILPEVVELMNRNTIQAQLVDPELNILESVRFMLEPGDQDAALPNYKIQRELFSILGKLPMTKEALIASGIGKVILFYTRSVQPQQEIKRQAEHLLSEWMRIVLNKHKAHRSAPTETRIYDPSRAQSQRTFGDINSAAKVAERRRKALEVPGPANRARVEGGIGTYTIQPISNLSNAVGVKRTGAAGDETFRRIAARSAAKTKK